MSVFVSPNTLLNHNLTRTSNTTRQIRAAMRTPNAGIASVLARVHTTESVKTAAPSSGLYEESDIYNKPSMKCAAAHPPHRGVSRRPVPFAQSLAMHTLVTLVLLTLLLSLSSASSCCRGVQDESPDTLSPDRQLAHTSAIGTAVEDAAPKKTGGCGMPTAFFAWAPGHKMEVLFSFWVVDSSFSYILTCIAIFLLGFVFEGYQTVQQLADESIKKANVAKLLKLGENCCRPNQFTRMQQAARAALHAIRVFLSLMLMLIFMLFEWGTALSLVAGAGVGFFVFHVFSPLSETATQRQAGCH